MSIRYLYSFLILLIFPTLLLSFFANSPYQVSGQVLGDGKADFEFSEDPKAITPELYVHDLVLDQAVYATGDTVSGNFSISNVKDINANDIFYHIQLVGNFNEAGFPKTVFDIGKPVGPLTINSGDKKRLDFSYKIPKEVGSSNLGIQIQTYLSNGRPSARVAESFLVSGPVIDYLEHIAQIQVDGEPFALTDGPTIFRGEDIFFAVSLSNDSSTIDLTPTIVVYDNFTTGRTLDTFNAPAITISSKGKKEQRIQLPTFNYAPGIYTAVIEYKDKDGRVRSGPFEARYVISGTEPKIDFISVDRTAVGANEQFNVFVQFADSPLDIRLGNLEENRNSNFSDLSVEVIAYDAENVKIDSKKAFFDQGKRSVQVGLTSTYDMNGYYVVANLYRGESVIDSVEKAFSDRGEFYVDKKTGPGNIGQIMVVASILFGIVIVAIVFVFLAVKKKGQAQENKEEIEQNINS